MLLFILVLVVCAFIMYRRDREFKKYLDSQLEYIEELKEKLEYYKNN